MTAGDWVYAVLFIRPRGLHPEEREMDDPEGVMEDLGCKDLEAVCASLEGAMSLFDIPFEVWERDHSEMPSGEAWWRIEPDCHPDYHGRDPVVIHKTQVMG